MISADCFRSTGLRPVPPERQHHLAADDAEPHGPALSLLPVVLAGLCGFAGGARE
jgi:hypothetical protein